RTAAGAANPSPAPGPLARAGATAPAHRAGPGAAAHRPTAGRAGGLAMPHRPPRVHPHIIHTGRQLLLTLVGRVILNAVDGVANVRLPPDCAALHWRGQR